MLRVIAITGRKKSGKTKVIEGLIKELINRGYRVGTVKHVPKQGFTLDQSGTDTWRHAQAGSKTVVCISPDEVATLEKRKPDLEEILLSLRDLDFVILESFGSVENLMKIVVARNEGEASELDDDFTVGFIGKGVGGKSVLDPDDFKAIADLIEQKALPPTAGLDCGDCDYGTCKEFVLAALAGKAPKNGCRPLFGRVLLMVDGRRVPLKIFMQDLIAGTIVGMLTSLKGAKGEEIKIEVIRHER